MNLRRADHHVETIDGVRLRIRTVEDAAGATRGPIVLVHGIAAPLEPTYDLDVPGYSFLEELARRGYAAIAFDHRNFGASDRDPAMAGEPVAGRGMHSLADSVEDIRAVVADTCTRRGVDRLPLFGSSRGAIQVLAYAVRDDARLTLAILNNPSSLCYLSGATSGAALDAMHAERTKAARSHSFVPYTAEFQRGRWKKLFGDHVSVDQDLQERYIAACIRSDEEGSSRTPPVFRVPTETFPEEVPLVDVARLRTPLLVIEAEEIPETHVAALIDSAPAGKVRVVFIRDSNHFTLRNDRRFELANLIDVAVTSRTWNSARAS